MRSLFLPAVILVLSLDGLSLAQNEDSLVFRKDASVESGGLVADDTLAGAEPHFIVRIDRLVVDDMKLLDTLDVVVESFGNGFAGAVLKLGASSRFIEILEVLPGEICDSCRWEFFRAFEVNTADKPGFPSMLWQVTALAKMSPDSSRPFCYGFAGPGSLLRMVVSSEHVAQVPDTMASVFFFWESCRDNVLSDTTGSLLAVSQKVLDYYSVELADERDVFPTRFGTPRQCLNPNLKYAPRRQIEFHNGGVEFRFDLGDSAADSVDSTVLSPAADRDR